MRVLAVGAHPDDVEFYCSGTLLACKARGDEVVVCCLANGDKGGFDMTCEELAAVREAEAQAAAKLMGAELICCGIPDGDLRECDEQRAVVIDAIRLARPDMIITHSPEDYHPDHCNASALVFSASFLATCPNVRGTRELPAAPTVPPLFYMDTPQGMGFQPTEYVDITPYWEQKVQIINCHKSQVQWIMEHDNLDLVEMGRVTAQFRGGQCGVRYAEGFRQLCQWPRMRAERVLP